MRVVVAFLILALACPVHAAGKTKPSPPATADARRVAAEHAYQGALEAYKAGRGSLEAVYVWSQRLRDADGSKDGRQAHVSRMSELEVLVQALVKKGAATAADADAATYYRLTAEQEL